VPLRAERRLTAPRTAAGPRRRAGGTPRADAAASARGPLPGCVTPRPELRRRGWPGRAILSGGGSSVIAFAQVTCGGAFSLQSSPPTRCRRPPTRVGRLANPCVRHGRHVDSSGRGASRVSAPRLEPHSLLLLDGKGSHERSHGAAGHELAAARLLRAVALGCGPGCVQPGGSGRRVMRSSASRLCWSASARAWRYFWVVWMWAWPRRSMTDLRSEPPASNYEAWACRRSWMRTLKSIPLVRTAGYQTRVREVLREIGVPAVVVMASGNSGAVHTSPSAGRGPVENLWTSQRRLGRPCPERRWGGHGRIWWGQALDTPGPRFVLVRAGSPSARWGVAAATPAGSGCSPVAGRVVSRGCQATRPFA